MRCPEQVENFMSGREAPVGFQQVKISLSVNQSVKNSLVIVQVEGATQLNNSRITKACANIIIIAAGTVQQRWFITFHLNIMNTKDRKKIFLTASHQGEKRYEFKVGWGCAPHPDKVWKGGEDALFVSKNILIVADGVGGWSRLGIDSGAYSRRLIAAVKEALESEKELYYIDRPEELALTAVQKNEEKGSATLTIITLHPFTGLLRSYYIGDSVFGIFSPTGRHFIAQEQQRQFNVPYQVFGGKNNLVKSDSDSQQEQPVSDVSNGCYNQFNPSETIQRVIVVASDGLWDNIPEQQIQHHLFTNSDLVTKTKSLVRRAKELANLSEYESPFYLKAIKKGHSVPKCGKVDDITLILAEIVQIS